MDEIYKEYAKTVYGFLLIKCRNSDLAEELTQETFYQATLSINRFKGDCKMSSYLCGIAKNVWLKYLKKHKDLELDDSMEIEDHTTLNTIENDLQREILYKSIHTLKEPYKEIVYLRILGNLSFKSIGEIFGKKETWARVMYYRAKEMIKEKSQDE